MRVILKRKKKLLQQKLNIQLWMLLLLLFSRSVVSNWLFATPWTAACQASLFFIISWSLLKLMSIEWVMPFNHLFPCYPLLHLPSIFPSIRVFSNESVLHIRWPKYWSFSSYYPHNMRIEHWYVLRLGTHSVSNLKRVIRPQSHGRQCGKDGFTRIWL